MEKKWRVKIRCRIGAPLTGGQRESIVQALPGFGALEDDLETDFLVAHFDADGASEREAVHRGRDVFLRVADQFLQGPFRDVEGEAVRVQ